jgi:hypothetical protein
MPLVNIHAILPCKIAFGKTEVMNGIQQIGFANAVAAANAHNAFGKVKLLMEIILELKQRYSVKVKAQISALMFCNFRLSCQISNYL